VTNGQDGGDGARRTYLVMKIMAASSVRFAEARVFSLAAHAFVARVHGRNHVIATDHGKIAGGADGLKLCPENAPHRGSPAQYAACEYQGHPRGRHARGGP